MTSKSDDGPGALHLVAADLFFGLGAVMLVAVAAVSLGLQEMVARTIADATASPAETRDAAASLAVQVGTAVLLADEQGLHLLENGATALIATDDLWSSDLLADWLADDPLLVIAVSGQDAAFLTYSRAVDLRPDPLATLRLPHECRNLRPTPDGVLCEP
jgi:hypothetical protein